MTLSREITKQRVHAAYMAFVARDHVLLDLDANERSLTHKLAEHLQVQFDDWDVDCEYNRAGAVPKTLQEWREFRIEADDTDAKTVFPDIIIHRRNTDENFIVIEAKKSSTVEQGNDETKLQSYLTEHGYRFAFAVVFPVGAYAASASTLDIAEVRL